VAVPVFAFFAAGVGVGGMSGLRDSFADPITLGIVAGLLIGKPVGIFGTTWLVGRFTHATLDENLEWLDVLGLALLAGIGFTVSLLIGDLAFGLGSEADDHVKVGILTGSVASALVAAVLVKSRDRAYRRILEQESVDTDSDGIPDVYEEGPERD
jgi:NhaA family Na+:H+ antiporter